MAGGGAEGAACSEEDTRMKTGALIDCAGYRLVTRDGMVGNVVAVVPSNGDDGSGALVVHSGPSCDLVALSFDEVEGVDVQGRRVVVRTARTR